MHGARFFPGYPLRFETSAGPLEDGDCLSSKEFLRRCESLPGPKKIELIQGIVSIDSNVGIQERTRALDLILTCLQTYADATPGTAAATNAVILLDRENVARPDGALRILPEFAGRTQVNEKGYLAGAPELIVEILLTRGISDLRNKLAAFCRNGVLEYLIWRLAEKKIEWFQLEKGGYVLNLPGPNNILCSREFPGLALNVTALLAREVVPLKNTLKSGMNSAQHATFVARLASRNRSGNPRQTASKPHNS